jgi:hypothetical protein
VGYGSAVQPQNPAPEIGVAQDLAAPPSPPPIDSHVARPHDAVQTASAGTDQQPHPSLPVIPISADFLPRVPQAANDVAKISSSPATAVPVAVQQPAAPPNLATDAGLNRTPIGIVLIPQLGIDAMVPPAARVPQAVPNLGRIVGSVALPGNENERTNSDEDERANSEDAAINLSFDGPADNEIPTTASPGNRAALLANLQLNMEAVDQALDTMVNEIERLGGELATWLDDWSLSSWGTAATVVAAFGLGGRYIWRGRGRRLPQEDTDEESSSWLFTRLQSPAGQP